MIGRFLGLAVFIAALSVGMAKCASRTPTLAEAESSSSVSGNHDNWTTQPRAKGGWSSGTAQRSAGGEVRLGRSGDSHFYADASIDGRRIRMMVDSGASIIALTRRDAETLGIDVDGLPIGGQANTAGGTVPLRPVMLDSVAVDGIEKRRVQAAVIDADMGVSLLGQSFLSRLDAVNVEGDTMTLR